MSSKQQKSSRYYIEVIRPLMKSLDSFKPQETKERVTKQKELELGRVVQFNTPQKIG